MSNLSRIQQDFQEYLMRSTVAIVDHVTGTERVSLATRLRIYSDSYYARLTAALRANYPALAHFLGKRDFGRLAVEYITTHDSRFHSIRYYGDELPQYLATEPRYRPMPVLADLARWEWTMAAVYDAADAQVVDGTELVDRSPADWAAMRLTFHPSVHVLEFAWNAPQIWKAVIEGAETPAAAVSREPTSWLLWRHHLQEFHRPLDSAEEDALATALAGQPFDEIASAMRAHFSEEEATAHAALFLRSWVDAGLVTAVT